MPPTVGPIGILGADAPSGPKNAAGLWAMVLHSVSRPFLSNFFTRTLQSLRVSPSLSSGPVPPVLGESSPLKETVPWTHLLPFIDPSPSLPYFRMTDRYLKAHKRRIAIKHALISVLCLLVVFCGYTFWSPRQTSGPMGGGTLVPRDNVDDPGPPAVSVDRATIFGKKQGQTEAFQGLPYAQPPVGQLRFSKPEPYPPFTGVIFANQSGPSCPQVSPNLVPPQGLPDAAVQYTKKIQAVYPDSEDCLTLDIIRPAGTGKDSKLPVVVWFFGGGLQFGGISRNNGSLMVARSTEVGTPVIFVAMNYRLNAFGFLAGEEVKAAGVSNLGLRDQRAALQWVQKYIAAFGGDPGKVTLWGQGAGGTSIGSQIVINQGDSEGLFRGAIMQSGSPQTAMDISTGQQHYDNLVSQLGCAQANNTLDCLRNVPYDNLKLSVQNISPGLFSSTGLSLTWPITIDGDLLSDSPIRLVQAESVAQVPVLIGNVDDEGTLFALSVTDIKTDGDVRRFVSETYLNGSSNAEVDKIMSLYPDDIAQGSPFNTSDRNQFSPQFKRMAALLGDMGFIAPRRYFAQSRSDKQPVYVFLSQRFKDLEVLGAAHGSDLLDPFDGGVTADYFIQFVTSSDPNGHSTSNRTTLVWPKYSNGQPSLMTFFRDLATPTSIGQDDYRKDPLNEWNALALGKT